MTKYKQIGRVDDQFCIILRTLIIIGYHIIINYECMIITYRKWFLFFIFIKRLNICPFPHKKKMLLSTFSDAQMDINPKHYLIINIDICTYTRTVIYSVFTVQLLLYYTTFSNRFRSRIGFAMKSLIFA